MRAKFNLVERKLRNKILYRNSKGRQNNILNCCLVAQNPMKVIKNVWKNALESFNMMTRASQTACGPRFETPSLEDKLSTSTFGIMRVNKKYEFNISFSYAFML